MAIEKAEGRLIIDIADTAVGVHAFDAAAMAPLTFAEFNTARASCIWAPGTTLPRAKGSHDARSRAAGREAKR